MYCLICFKDRNEFRDPENCKDAECWVLIQWQEEENYVNFNVSGTVTSTQEYLAMGFSESGNMVCVCMSALPFSTLSQLIRTNLTLEVENSICNFFLFPS